LAFTFSVMCVAFRTISLLAPATAGAPLTGTVQFFDDGAPLGNAVALANGQAVLTAALPTFGTHAVTAAYSGDAARNQSLSAAVGVAVEEFALSANAATVTKGQVASVPITVAASNGFSSSIDFSCALPSALTKATCTVSPTSLAGSGTITLLVNTTADHKQPGLSGMNPPSAPALARRRRQPGTGWPRAAADSPAQMAPACGPRDAHVCRGAAGSRLRSLGSG
jgi:hypothetical protein